MNPEILTGHTCSEGDGCSPEHRKRLVSDLNEYQKFQLAEIVRLHKRMNSMVLSILLRLTVSAACLAGAAESVELCVWQSTALHQTQTAMPSLFDAFTASGADCIGFSLAAMAAVLLTCLGAYVLRSAFTFRRSTWQELVNAILLESYAQDMIDTLEPPSEHPDGEAVAEHKESN